MTRKSATKTAKNRPPPSQLTLDISAISSPPAPARKVAKKPQKRSFSPSEQHNTSQIDPESAPTNTLVAQFLSDMGQERIIAALEHSGDVKAIQLAEMMLDPSNARIRFSTLYRRLGLTMAHIMGYFTDFQRDSGFVALSSQIPTILAGVASHASSREVPCVKCDETGKVVREKLIVDEDGSPILDENDEMTFEKGFSRCPACFGAKIVTVQGDKAAREIALEAAGITGKKVPLIAMQMNFGGASAHEDDILITQRLIEGSK